MHSMYGSYRSGPEVLFQDLRRDEIRGWWWWMMMIVAQRANRYIVVFHIAISYNIYWLGGSGQATLCNTAAAVSVLSVAIIVTKGGGGQWH